VVMSAGYIPFHPNPSKPKYRPPRFQGCRYACADDRTLVLGNSKSLLQLRLAIANPSAQTRMVSGGQFAALAAGIIP
jgi:hypothetical protein